MYPCPNCGGALKFDIPSQQMKCEHCEAQMNPYQIEEKTDAIEQQTFETTIFTCSQCGGEVYSVDNEAASFCSFCGSPAILSSRLNTEKRPAYIIPFKVTKEDCKKAFAKKMRYAFFAPNEFKNPENLHEFRGIYMPYWSYQITQQSHVNVPGEKSYRNGDYIITEHYNLSFDLDASYAGFSHDASGSFYDSISESLAPYNVKDMVSFTPAFLSGYYADTADVDSQVYLQDALDCSVTATIDHLNHASLFSGISYKLPLNPQEAFGTNCHSIDSTMYPVWFLTYQVNNRVAYATVNGQTGKVVTDMPLDGKKFGIASLLLTIPIYLILNLLFTIVPKTLLLIVSLLTLITTLIYQREISSIWRKQTNTDDLATQIKVNEKKTIMKHWRLSNMLVYTIIFPLFVIMFAFGRNAHFLFVKLFYPTSLILTICAAAYGMKKNKLITETGNNLGFICAILASILTALVGFFQPVKDFYYYAAAMCSIIAILYTMFDTIRNYNILSTRALPQFHKQGGDHRAY